VPKIHEARPFAQFVPLGRRPHSDVPGEVAKDPADRPRLQAFTTFIDEEGHARFPAAELITLTGVGCQFDLCRSINRHEARLPEFRISDGEDSVMKVYIGCIESHCLPRPKSSGSQEPKDCPDCQIPQVFGGTALVDFGHQAIDLLRRENVG
jgi:hypothetical protein